MKNITVGLDIGTSKICALVASGESSKQEGLEILGIGIAESEGLSRGVVVNIERTTNTIKKVIEQAEQQSGIKIKEVTVGIAGDHIESFETRGIIGISNPNKEVTKEDVQRLIENARSVKISSEREIIHVMPQYFIIDGQDGITDPIGMSGVRMEASVHIITGLRTAIQNIHRCVERCGVKVSRVVLEPYASSRALLTDEEKEVGVAIVDIGGGTTDIAIFEEDVIRYTSIFGLAGKHVTDDIRNVLGIIANQAERIKREYGHSYSESISKDEVFMIPGIGGRKPMEVSKVNLCNIIQPRMEELFEFALAEIKKSGFAERLGAGIVLTGGTCLLKGTEDLAHQVFGLPVKIGIPSQISYSGLAPEVESPIYSTGVGLALFGLEVKSNNSSENEIDYINDDSKPEEDLSKIENENSDTDQSEELQEKETKKKVPLTTRFKKFMEQL